MVTINLLPWRELARAHDVKRLRRILIFSLLVSVLFIYGCHYALLYQEKNLRAQVNTLKYTWWRMAGEKNIRHQQQDRMALLQQQQLLHASALAQRFFALWQTFPLEAICFTDVQHSGHMLQLVGRARSVIDINAFIQHVPTNSGLTAWRIDQVRQYKNQLFKFHIHAKEVSA